MNKNLFKKYFILMLLFLTITYITIHSIILHLKTFSFKELIKNFYNLNIFLVLLSFALVIIFLLLESICIKKILKIFNVKISTLNSIAYSSTDIYFSAITPSATGGQPMCVYFMIKDKLNPSLSCVTLLLYTISYTSSLTILGIIAFIINPNIFFCFSNKAQIIIIIGSIIQLIFVIFIYLLLNIKKFSKNITFFIFKILLKLKLIKKQKENATYLTNLLNHYNKCNEFIKNNKSFIASLFSITLLQRICQLIIPSILFLGYKYSFKQFINIFCIQILISIAVYCIPIPGGIFATDLLLINGLSCFLSTKYASYLELTSRFVQFYFLIIICGLITFCKYIFVKIKGTK